MNDQSQIVRQTPRFRVRSLKRARRGPPRDERCRRSTTPGSAAAPVLPVCYEPVSHRSRERRTRTRVIVARTSLTSERPEPRQSSRAHREPQTRTWAPLSCTIGSERAAREYSSHAASTVAATCRVHNDLSERSLVPGKFRLTPRAGVPRGTHVGLNWFAANVTEREH
jgi:hypothetical protein